MQCLKNLIKWFTTPTSASVPRCPPAYAMPPLTEGKTRGNIKPYPRGGRTSSPSPAIPPPPPKPKKTKCEWIEVYTPDYHGGFKIGHHDDAEFKIDTNGNLTVYWDGNTVVYRDYSKYTTRG